MKNISCSHSVPWRLAMPTDRHDYEFYNLVFGFVKQAYVVVRTRGRGNVFPNGTATLSLAYLQQHRADFTAIDFNPLPRRIQYFHRVVAQPYGIIDSVIITSRKDARIVGGIDWFHVFPLDVFVFVAFLALLYCSLTSIDSLVQRKGYVFLHWNYIRPSTLLALLIINWMLGAVLLNFQINGVEPAMTGLRDIPSGIERGMIRVEEARTYALQKGYATYIRLRRYKLEYDALKQLKPELTKSPLESIRRVAELGQRFKFGNAFYITQLCAIHPRLCNQLTAAPLFQPNGGYFVSFVSDQFPKLCYERLSLSMVMLDQYGLAEQVLVPYLKQFRKLERQVVWKMRSINFQDISLMFYGFLSVAFTATLLFIGERYYQGFLRTVRKLLLSWFSWATRQAIDDD